MQSPALSAAQLTQMLVGCVQPLGAAVFTKLNNHPSLLRDLRMPSQDVVGIISDIVRRAVDEASTLGSLAYVQTYYLDFPNNSCDPAVPLHFENAFLLTMELAGVYNPRATVVVEFCPSGSGYHALQLQLRGLVRPQ